MKYKNTNGLLIISAIVIIALLSVALKHSQQQFNEVAEEAFELRQANYHLQKELETQTQGRAELECYKDGYTALRTYLKQVHKLSSGELQRIEHKYYPEPPYDILP